MRQAIVISLIGKYEPGIVSEITRLIMESGGNITDSRMSELAGEFTMLCLVSGNWHTSKRLEMLSEFATTRNLDLRVNALTGDDSEPGKIPYAIDAVCLDQKGIVFQVADFFRRREIAIGDLSTRTYAASHTGASMFAIQMIIKIPADVHLSTLREEFLEFCDHINLDAILEPIKG